MTQKKSLAIRLGILCSILLGLMIISFTTPATAQATLKACQGNSICDIELVGSTPQYKNCQGCGTDIIYCNNRPTSVERVCKSSAGFTAQCASGPQTCAITGKSDPSAVVKFRIYIPKGIEITSVPETRANIAGRASDFKITVQNKNPITLDALISAEVSAENKEDWTIDAPKTLQLGANGKQEFQLKATSPAGTPDGDYPITITVVGFQTTNSNIMFQGKKTIIYQVASRAAPSISIEPATNTTTAGKSLEYAVTVMNNDPKDFDASGIALSAKVPGKWQVNFESRTLRLKSGETGTTKLGITSDKDAKQGPYEIEVSATVSGLTNSANLQYVVSTCGDEVCGVGEQCALDCPLETNFICNGRCEHQTDTGLDFSAQVKFAFSNFVICSKTATPQQCKSAFDSNSCGAGKSCLCGNRFDPECSTRCVDNTGAYYLFATELGSVNGRSSNANYSFECPFVDLDGIKALKAGFTSAKQDFEKSRSGIKESLNTATREQRQKLQPCYDGLGQVIQLLTGHITYLDEVIKFPAISNTTEARAKSADLRKNINSLHDQFCRGATGALQIASINIAQNMEKGKGAAGTVVVRNTGNINYYGYLSCDFTSPQGQKKTSDTACAPVSFGRDQTFNPESSVDAEGTWKFQCRSMGSLSPDCSSPEQHDQSEILTFHVFSRDTFVKDVSGTCTDQGATCTVRLSSGFSCAGCRIEDRECAKRSQDGESTTFSCPKAVPGKYGLTGYVIPTSQCNPVAPKEKTVQVQCSGCGDGTLQKDKGEQCELPNTNNNQNCGQTEFIIENGRRGSRDKYGFCTPQCQCSPDEFGFACVKGVGGATCNDGETRVATKTVDGQQVTCTEHCNAECIFDSCNAAEPPKLCSDDSQCTAGQKCAGGVCVSQSALTISARHAPDKPSPADQVTITANSNGQKTDIYVDGSVVKSCTSSLCAFTQTYSLGRHNYFAVTYRGSESKTDPIAGTKIFDVTQAGTSAPTVSVAHSPASPTTDQDVTITAAGSADRLAIFVDGNQAAQCDSSPCVYKSKFTEGTHTYLASANKDGIMITDPAAGTKSFVVTKGAVQPPAEQVTITLAHQPASPKTGDSVTLTTQASATSGIKEIKITADGQLRKTCASSPCEFSGTFAAGSHSYSATATSSAGKISSSESSFTVTQFAALSVSVLHSPAAPTTDKDVTITATGNGERMDIYADGFVVKTCTSSPCSYSQKYTAGQHSYFAAAYLGGDVKTDPIAGTKIFDVTQPGTTGQGPSDLSVTHSPALPTTDQDMTITATGNAEKLTIFVDGKSAAECQASPCTYTAKFTEGTHTYSLSALKNSVTATEPKTGAKSFIVTKGGTQPPGEEIAIMLRHSPASPKTDDTVTITATASTTSGIKEIKITADGVLKKTCQEAICEFSGLFAAGAHKYSASVTSNSGKTTSSESSFTVTQAALPTVSVTHSPSAPATDKDVTITATGSAERFSVFADGEIVAQCEASPCTYSAKFPEGTHTYFASASREGQTATDPPSGTKSFTVTRAGTIQPQAEHISITLAHEPAAPKSGDIVTVRAQASAASGIRQINITIDGQDKRICLSSPCEFSGSFAIGSHKYAANATSAAGMTARSESSFTVVQRTSLAVSVVHSPASPTTAQEVTVSAAGSGSKTSIFIDGLKRVECPLSCEYKQLFPAGVHTYFAVTENDFGSASDPAQGTKSFTVTSAGTQGCINDAGCPSGQVCRNNACVTPQQCTTNATCTAPPAPACIGAAFRRFSLPSACTAGACTYQQNDESCPNGCNATGCLPGNTTIIGGGENISISITHSPANPGIDDNVTFTATANRTVDRIQIFVDNFLKTACNATAICTYSQKLTVGNHDYYGIFTKNNTTGRTPTRQVFASSPLLASIRSFDIPENAILGANAALEFDLQNPDAAKFGKLTCIITTPTQARIATQCFPLPSQQSRQTLLVSANQLGLWNVTTCELNISARNDCANSQQSDVETNLGTFFVAQPTNIFISNARSPQSAVVNSNATINVTLQNPTDRSRFVKASCLLKTPGGQDINLQSQCLGLSLNSTRTMEMQFQPGVLGTWTLVSCASDASQSTDCSNAARTQTLALSRPINVVKSDNLDITSASISSSNITIGESVSVSVGIRNPTDIDRYAQTTCIFRTQNQANLPNSSSWSPIRKDETQNAIVTIKPPFVGRWNVTQCAALSSLNVDGAQSKQDDSLDNIGTFEVSNPQPPGGGGGPGGNGTGGGTGNGTAEKCEILRFKTQCIFSKTTNRYTVSADMTWNGGDHAHVIIGDDTGELKYTEKTFTAGKVIATPGKISVKPVVHDANDNVRCSNASTEVLCVAGNATTTPDVQIFRRMPSVASPGPVQVELVMQPLENVANFTITEHAEQSLPIINVVIGGNQTLVYRSSATVASLDSNKTLTAWSFNTALRKNQNISIAYTVSPLEERDYKFFYVANISGDILQEKPFNLFITNCEQKTPVWASAPSGACIQYRVSCLVPKDWVIVEKCPDTTKPPPGGGGDGGDSTALIVAIVILIIILVLGYKKRDDIREWIREHKKQKNEEEIPSLRNNEER